MYDVRFTILGFQFVLAWGFKFGILNRGVAELGETHLKLGMKRGLPIFSLGQQGFDECGFWIGDFGLMNCRCLKLSEIHNPQSTIHNPQSEIHNPQSEMSNPKSTIRNPKSPCGTHT